MSINFKDNQSSIKSRYRPEIDGLRAFAVITVIINHFNKDILPSGYLGVDIFFVISGFVITSSLYKRPSKDFKDFISGFYERRLKRLIPALSVFVLIISIAISLFNPFPQLSIRTGLTSLFGLSNLYLIKQSTNYFAQSTELNVFTHTWSLGVEAQFYILFPFLIWFSGFGRQAKNGARNLFFTISALSIASLIVYLYLYPINQSAAYFLMPSRFWEMASGCLLFIGLQKKKSIEEYVDKFPSLLLLVLIVGIMYLPMSWASSSTIAVVFLSSILIASFKKQTRAYIFFTNPKIVYIGLISYSLYLWHWGILSISRWTIGIHWWSVPFQIALILGLAIVSFRFIETPLRKGNLFGKRWKNLMASVGFLVSFAGILIIFAKKQTIFLGTTKSPYGEAELPESVWSKKNCSGSRKSKNIVSKKEFKNCFLISSSKESPKNKKTLFVFGDSYAQQIIPILGTLSNNIRYKVNLVYSSGCPSLFNLQWSLENPIGVCSERWKNYLEWVNKIGQNGDILLLANSNHYYFTKKLGDGVLRMNEKVVTRKGAHKMLSNDLIKTANILRKNNVNLVVASGIPYLNSSNCDQWFSKHNNRCNLDSKKNKLVKDTRNVQLLAAKKGSFLLLDFYSKIENSTLENTPQNTSVFYDNPGHLNSKGVRNYIYPVILESLTKLREIPLSTTSP